MSGIGMMVETLWKDLVDSHFDADDFIKGVMRDLGHDASGVTASDFREMLDTGTCSAMQDMGWCCNEVLSFYLVEHLGSAQFVRALFIALCAVKAIEAGAATWDFIFDKLLMLLVQSIDKTDYRFRMELLKTILCNKNVNGGVALSGEA